MESHESTRPRCRSSPTRAAGVAPRRSEGAATPRRTCSGRRTLADRRNRARPHRVALGHGAVRGADRPRQASARAAKLHRAPHSLIAVRAQNAYYRSSSPTPPTARCRRLTDLAHRHVVQRSRDVRGMATTTTPTSGRRKWCRSGRSVQRHRVVQRLDRTAGGACAGGNPQKVKQLGDTPIPRAIRVIGDHRPGLDMALVSTRRRLSRAGEDYTPPPGCL